MPNYTSPGVYIEEIASGVRPMEGASTSTVGFVGVAKRGKVYGVPEFVGSFGEYKRKFGGYLSDGGRARHYMPNAVEQFFANGGSRCYVVRVLDVENGADDNKLKFKQGSIISTTLGSLTDTPKVLCTFTTTSEGSWADSLELKYRADPVDTSKYEFSVVCDGIQESYQKVSLQKDTPNFITSVFEKSLFVNATVPAAATFSQLSAAFNAGLCDCDERSAADANEWSSVALAYATLPNPYNRPSPFSYPNKVTDAIRGEDGGTGSRSGLCALEDVSDISIVVVPGSTADAELAAITAHCKKMGNRVCILDMPEKENNLTELKKHRLKVMTSRAAMYHPWTSVYNPLVSAYTFIPPSGAVAGIYARTDSVRGVFKAPANEVVAGCNALQVQLGTPEQDILNPLGINLIRNIPGQGIRVWGARTCSSDTTLRYVNVRRTLIYIEETIRNNMGWVVFEPNQSALWTKIKGTVKMFLGTMWREGALVGASEEKAYFVDIGLGTTMTQDDINNGRLICEIGVAISHPAEFVVFRISQIMESNS